MSQEIKRKIFEEVKKEIPELSVFAESDLDFYLFRHKHTLRLTADGARILKKIYGGHEFKYDTPIDLEAGCVLSLSKKLKLPYYIGTKVFVMFEDKEAFLLKLHANDMRKWLSK